MKERDESFTPYRLKRAVNRLDYIERWIDRELLKNGNIIQKMEKKERDRDKGFLSKLFSIFKLKRSNVKE